MLLKPTCGRHLLSAVLRPPICLPVLVHSPVPTLSATISSSAGSNSSSLLTTESLHARYSVFTVKELKEQLLSRNLKATGKKLQLVERLASNDVFCARKSSTLCRQDSAWGNLPKSYVPEIPKPMEMEKPNPPILVPITPDNKFAHHYRHDLEASPPTKHLVSTVSDAENIADLNPDVLADILKPISVEEPTYMTEQQYARNHSETKDSVKGITGSEASSVHIAASEKDSHIVPGAVLPTKYPVTTISDAENVSELVADALVDILEPTSVGELMYITEKYAKKHRQTRDPVKDTVENVASGAHTAGSREDSLLYIAARFPVEVVKDMMEDMFPVVQQHERKQENTGQQTEVRDESPQELTEGRKRALYTIGGLSVAWYFFGY